MALPEHLPYIDRALTAYHADIGTASSAYVYCPFNGRIVSIHYVEHAAVSGGDAAITTKINGTTIGATGAATIAASGSAVRRARHHHAGRDQRHRGRRRLHRARLRRRAVERVPGDVDHRGAGRLIRRRRMTMQKHRASARRQTIT